MRWGHKHTCQIGTSWVLWSELVPAGCMNLNMLLRTGGPQFPQLKAGTVGILTDFCKNHTHSLSEGNQLKLDPASYQAKALPGP